MGSKVNSKAQRLKQETERILHESRAEIRAMHLSEKEARDNIRHFLEHLQQFEYDPPENPDFHGQ